MNQKMATLDNPEINQISPHNNDNCSSSSNVDLLWTGGWDSTFRLLYLLFETEAIVQPWYLIYEERRSTGMEIHTMQAIRNAINKKNSSVEKRLMPTRYKGVAELNPNHVVTDQYKRLSKKAYLGPQYNWLTRFALEHKIKCLELSIHRDDKAYAFVLPYIYSYTDKYGSNYKLNNKLDNSDLELFRPFRFPLLNLSKIDMEQHAHIVGYSDILEMTWFCHYPINKKPCGMCNPCTYTLEEGLKRRIPNSRRFMRLLRLITGRSWK